MSDSRRTKVRLLWALVPAIVVATGFGISILAVSPDSYWRPWGMLWGTFSFLVTLGIGLMVGGRRGSNTSRVGRGLAVTTLLVLAYLFIAAIVAWGIPINTLEGAWIYPTGFVPLGVAVWLLISGRRKKAQAKAEGRAREA